MGAKVKIALIGAGSAQFSAGIVRDLCVCPALAGSQVILMDIDEERLALVHRLAQKIAGELGASLSFQATTDRRQALRGADFVLNTVQIKAGELEGHEWVERQRAIAERHGYYRGLRLHHFGQMHFMLELAREMEEVCPDAYLIQSGNPVFEGCTLIHRQTGIKVIGLCHGHYGYLDIARTLGLREQEVTAQMSGFNHWIWMTDFRYQGKDAYPLLDDWIANRAQQYWEQMKPRYSDMQLTRGAVHQYQLFGLMPIGDAPRQVGRWYHTSLEEKKRRFGPLGGFDSEIGWADYLKDIEENLQKIREAALDDSRPATSIFEPRQSKEQIVPLINSLVNDCPGVYQLNIPNRGFLVEGFPENLVVECQGIADGSGVRGIKMRALPPKVMAGAMIPRWREAEQAVECMRQQSRSLLLLYILNDPRTRSLSQAQALLEEWLNDPHNDRLRHYFK